MSDEAEVRALIAAADAVLEHAYSGKIAYIGAHVDMIRALRDALALRPIALEAAHAEPDDDDREALARYFWHRRTGQSQDAFDYLLKRDKIGREGVPESIWAEADAALAAGFSRRGTPATVEQVAEAIAPWLSTTMQDPDGWAMERARQIAASLYSFIVLNREPTESQTGDDR